MKLLSSISFEKLSKISFVIGFVYVVLMIFAENKKEKFFAAMIAIIMGFIFLGFAKKKAN